MEPSIQLSFGLALGVLVLASLTVLFFKLRRLGRPSIEFRDLVYDKAAGQLELYVSNRGGRPVYVNPSLRLTHFLDPEEWRGKKSNGCSEEMLEGRCYGVDSVIKGYTLLGESGAVMVEGGGVKRVVYPLDGEMRLSVCDNIRVDSKCGFYEASGDFFSDTMRVSLKDGHEGFDCFLEGPASPERLNPNRLFETTSAENAKPVFNYISGDVSQCVDAPAYNPDFCVVKPEVDGNAPTVEGIFPLQAVCVCCGREKWLEWVVDGNYVCAGCKDFLQGGVVDAGQPAVPAASAEECGSAPEGGVDSSVLKPRQREILNLLEHENNLTVKKISKMLSAKESTVSSDLKRLMKKDRVGRVHVGGRYLYHPA